MDFCHENRSFVTKNPNLWRESRHFSISRAILALAQNPKKAKELAINAKLRVAQLFDLGNTVQQYAALYSELQLTRNF